VATKKKAPKKSAAIVYVVDAWDDDAQESYVAVFATPAKARADLRRWRVTRAKHATYAGVMKRAVS
jgi:hypothetical protein